MTTLHWRFIALLAWLTFFFNIERLVMLGSDAVQMSWTVYVLGGITAIIPFAPIANQRSLLFLSVFTVLCYWASLVITGTPLFGGAYTYLNFTGLILLLVTLVVAKRVTAATQEFRDAVEMLTLTDGGQRLRTLKEMRDMVDNEMVRSRRFERPLSLVIVQADASSVNMQMHKMVQEVQRSMMQRYVLSTMARMLSRTLRRTDIVVEDKRPGRLLVVAPETNDENAVLMGTRVVRIIRERMGIDATYSFASFPQQALTFEDLLNVAEQRLQSEPASVKEDQDDEILDLGQRPVVAKPE